MTEEQFEYLHDQGKVPDWWYYQQSKKPMWQKYQEQKDQFYREWEQSRTRERAEKNVRAEQIQMEQEISEQAEVAIQNAIGELLDGFVF